MEPNNSPIHQISTLHLSHVLHRIKWHKEPEIIKMAAIQLDGGRNIVVNYSFIVIEKRDVV